MSEENQNINKEAETVGSTQEATSQPESSVENQAAPESAKKEGGNHNLWAVIAYFIFFLPLLTEHKDDPYVKFHVKQGLVLLLSFVVQMVIGIIPVIGWIAAIVLWFGNIILLIIGVINASTGKQKELPLIGKLAENFKF